jgi:hypothetical protein
MRSVETEGTLGAVERRRIGGIPMRPLRWPYTRSETLDVTTKHTVSSCAAAFLLDGDAGIGKTTIAAAHRRLFRVLACRRSASESALSLVGPVDLRDRIPEDAR